MSNNADRMAVTPVDQQNNHLAVTLIRPVMRAWTIFMTMPGNLQVKRSYHAQVNIGQLPTNPINSFVTRLF
jgi:hypothetical protein